MIFADVIVDISVKSLDRPFQYIVPEEMIDDAVIGAMVIIPFGSGNRELKGYIIGLSGEAKFDVERTKAGSGCRITPAFPCLLDQRKLRLHNERCDQSGASGAA